MSRIAINKLHTIRRINRIKECIPSGEIKNAQDNFSLNGFNNKAEFIQSDVFDYLEKCKTENKKFDIINLDPPAFAKSKKTLATAIKGYEKLNRLAMDILKDNGLLFTSSCSHHLKEEMFLNVINKAALKAGRRIQLFYFNNASLDHPSLPAMEETVYLKFAASCKISFYEANHLISLCVLGKL